MALIYPEGLASTDFSDGATEAGWAPQTYLYGAHISIPSSGTVTQMGVKARTQGGSQNIKFGLYTSSGVLVVQSTGTVALGGSVTWIDSGAVSASVSAGTHYVMVSAASNVVNYGYDTSGDGTYATEAYATAMQATETLTVEGDAGLLYGVRLDFTAGGGGSTSYLPPNFMRRLMPLLQM